MSVPYLPLFTAWEEGNKGGRPGGIGHPRRGAALFALVLLRGILIWVKALTWPTGYRPASEQE